jgi:hypothetical protein
MNRQSNLERWQRGLRRAAAATLLLVLAACGGGGDGGIDGTGGGSGGIDGTGVAYGTIDAFGSVWVNGVRYATTGAAITLDGAPANEAQLRVGMVARVQGSIAAARADVIGIDEALKGRVEQVIDASRMVVMGQQVLIDNRTRFEDDEVPLAGDAVEVHGLVSGDGEVTAGFVERKSALAPTTPFVVKGLVRNHDTSARRFTIGALTVDYAAGLANDMPAGSWNGLLVEAKGAACAGSPVCGTLTASRVEPAGAGIVNAPDAEVEGFIAGLTADGFTLLAGVRVVVTAATQFEGGTRDELAVGSKVEAEGPVANGVLTAEKVKFKDSIRLEGNVVSVDAAAGTLTLAGLPGLTVRVSSLTEFDKVAGLAQLAAGNHVEIKARPGNNGSVLAIELELDSAVPEPRVILQGAVSAVSGTTSVTILGITVNTAGIADGDFKGLNDAPIGRAAFFAALTTGTVVKVRGDLGSGGAVVWDEIELED